MVICFAEKYFVTDINFVTIQIVFFCVILSCSPHFNGYWAVCECVEFSHVGQHSLEWRTDKDNEANPRIPHHTTINFMIIKTTLNFKVNIFRDVTIFRWLNTFAV
jgi:hypothetical protein